VNAAAVALFAKRDVWRDMLVVKAAANTEVNRWWLKAALPLRGYLLAQSGVDDVYRFIDTPWQSLPDGLRGSIVVNTKSLSREIAGCGWL
jgi:hypothetical protein